MGESQNRDRETRPALLRQIRRYLKTTHGAVTVRQGDWHRITILDEFAKYPETAYVSLALVMDGPGKAFFDDLELFAFDKNNLPEKFEAKYGLPKHDPKLFDRWVGQWETTSEYKATATSEARTVKGHATVRKLFDDSFLLWQWKSEDGQKEYLWLLAFDKYKNAYHIWILGSGGETFERIGQWDPTSESLRLDLKSPKPGITGVSTDHFVSDDRIESTLLIRSPDGQPSIDSQMTSIRTSD